jgi:hypothetical protein
VHNATGHGETHFASSEISSIPHHRDKPHQGSSTVECVALRSMVSIDHPVLFIRLSNDSDDAVANIRSLSLEGSWVVPDVDGGARDHPTRSNGDQSGSFHAWLLRNHMVEDGTDTCRQCMVITSWAGPHRTRISTI